MLLISFISLTEYLWLLKEATAALKNHKSKALLYLAAAVSDFYIPYDQLAEHKLQSSDGAPDIKLALVPKILAPLVSKWVPQALTISFKLETDPKILLKKCHDALNKYKHRIVIGNLLATRRTAVIIVTPTEQYTLELSPDDIAAGVEIEAKLVADITRRHEMFIAESASSE
uniref:Phosphopantothenate--cysteine ligase n=1 Tax=Lygus hesperus TaxID=30085 RepID=A0A0A9XQ10_LYGHE